MPAAGGHLLVEADGGSRGNPGVAGYGALVRTAEGVLLAERAAPLGQASNNVAEYSGLIAGLQAVLDLGLAAGAQVEVRMDSKLVVEQMSGRWKIKHADMRRLALQARDLAGQIRAAGGVVGYVWIPRAENADADALSNDGMDGRTVHRDHIEAPATPRPAPEPDSLFDLPGEDAGSATSTTASSTTTAPEPATDLPDPQEPTFGDSRAPVGEVLFSTETEPTLDGPCHIVLVRHGVTDFTRSHRVDGRGGADPDLNAEGLAQAEAAAGAVQELLERSGASDVTVVTSSLARAMQTGAAVGRILGVTPTVDRDWDEQAFGDWDGRTMPDLVNEFGPDLLALRQDPAYSRPGGESRAELTDRVTQALARAVARGGTVVVATHRIPIMVVLSQVLGIDADRGWSLATAPASLTALEFWTDGGVQVAFVNDTHHLHDLA